MEREQTDPARDEADREAISRIEGLRESEVPWGYGSFESTISPNEGVVEIGSDPKTHPLRSGRIHRGQ